MPATTDLLNKPALDFSLPVIGADERLVLSNMLGRVVVLHFWSAECPWSRRADLVIVYRYPKWEKSKVSVVGIACNPNETEGEIRYEANARHLPYPVVADFAQDITNSYRVQTTPHFVVIDPQGLIRYTGALDDATANNRLPKTIYLDRAVNAVLRDQLPVPAVTQAYGSAVVRQMPSDQAA
jgi:alkyl hydroperoxide reductase subunit AhpC